MVQHKMAGMELRQGQLIAPGQVQNLFAAAVGTWGGLIGDG